jgi:hypothetical protein
MSNVEQPRKHNVHRRSFSVSRSSVSTQQAASGRSVARITLCKFVSVSYLHDRRQRFRPPRGVTRCCRLFEFDNCVALGVCCPGRCGNRQDHGVVGSRGFGGRQRIPSVVNARRRGRIRTGIHGIGRLVTRCRFRRMGAHSGATATGVGSRAVARRRRRCRHRPACGRCGLPVAGRAVGASIAGTAGNRRFAVARLLQPASRRVRGAPPLGTGGDTRNGAQCPRGWRRHIVASVAQTRGDSSNPIGSVELRWLARSHIRTARAVVVEVDDGSDLRGLAGKPVLCHRAREGHRR